MTTAGRRTKQQSRNTYSRSASSSTVSSATWSSEVRGTHAQFARGVGRSRGCGTRAVLEVAPVFPALSPPLCVCRRVAHCRFLFFLALRRRLSVRSEIGAQALHQALHANARVPLKHQTTYAHQSTLFHEFPLILSLARAILFPPPSRSSFSPHLFVFRLSHFLQTHQSNATDSNSIDFMMMMCNS